MALNKGITLKQCSNSCIWCLGMDSGVAFGAEQGLRELVEWQEGDIGWDTTADPILSAVETGLVGLMPFSLVLWS